MRFSRTYTTIESHAAGEPLRIVTAGVPRIPGATMLEKRRWVRENLDHVRRTLIHEPRGHGDMYGCYLTEPTTPEADLGVIFMHNEGYSSMCGHGIISLATVAVSQGLVAPRIPETRVGIDTPAGFVEAFAQWDGESVGEVRFRNVPSFLFMPELEIDTPDFGRLVVDVAYGGAFYAYLEADQVGLEVLPRHLPRLVELGAQVKHAVEAATEVAHPLEPELRGIYGTIVAGPGRSPGRSQRNVCVFAEREVDRSPTGTGTAGRVAQLVARGRLGLGESLVNESIIGTVFTGRALERTSVGGIEAIVPEVAGRAFVTGFNQWVVDPDDPVAEGFFLR